MEKPSQWIWVAALAAAMVCAGAGCRGPQKKVARQEALLRAEWEANYQQQANLPERTLDWPSAVAWMLENNLKLRQARVEVTNSQEQLRQVYKDLIPTLNLRSGISKRFGDFDAISPDDVTFNADSFFNIPGFVSFGARLYAAQLYALRARAAYQLAEREQMVELYRLYHTAEEFRDEQERVKTQRAMAGAMTQVDPFSGRLMQTELETRELGLSREAAALQDRAAEVLGSRSYRWRFSTNGIPELRYHAAPLPLADTNRVAQLQLKLLAVELEAARAQLFGMKLRYWPELNIFISSPPIYQIQSGQEYWWDADELRASADLFWSIDTRGNVSRMVRQTKRQQELQRERYRQESLSLMNRLLLTQELIKTVERQIARVEGQLALLLAAPPAQDYLALQKYTYDYRSLTQQQLTLKRELSELNALFWFVDDYAWRDQITGLPKG